MSSLRPAPGQDAPAVRAVALDVAARAASYAFAEKDDPRAAEGELGQFALRWVLAILQGMGALREPGEACELDQLERRLGIVPKYHRHFSALIRRLEDEGLVTVGGEDGRTVQATEQVRHYALEAVEEQVAAFQASFPERHPACTGLMQFMVRCLSRFEEIVTGRIDAADVVFQDGNMDIFGEVFGGDIVSDYFNRLVAEAVRSTVARAGEGAKVRIVEVGAGTGRTTAAILEAIQPFAEAIQPFAKSIEFWFTDISLSFVRYARRRFSEQYPWIEYRALNIEQDPAGQGFEAHSFDIVVAANVLHDTRDIEVTLEQTRRLLKPGGLLVLNEFTSPKDCLFFSGALLHGYWLFEDPERRQRDSCLLSVPQWGNVLERTGFTVVESFVLPTQSASAACSQSVILGAASGTVEKAAAGADAGASPEKLAILGRCLEEDILTLLGEERASAYAARRPLMEMGLDSIELTELKFFVRERFGITLSPTFLFEHETQEKMTRALAALVSSEQLPDLPPRLSQEPPQETVRKAGPQEKEEGIAIVGIACRFPGGATSPEAFWKLLERGGHGIVPMPAGRWQWPSFIDVAGKHKGIDQAGFLERIDELDARFFRISPKEAEFMDPQQRLLLELSWEALEDGGCRPSELAGRKIGVFVGACQSDYRDVLVAGSDAAEGYVGSGTAYAMLANRLSYFYDFKGPSLTVDTACSSSLFALHDAMNALQRGDCEQALVGAVNLLCSPTISISYYQAGMLSPTGRCRTFDETADGYVRGEGGAMLLLKPLALAVEHGDAIYGLVKGTAVNHGGQASTLTAPKPDAQADVIETAWRQAGATPDSVGYIEAHGTGTRLGDPIEISGLTEAFRRLYRAQGKSLPPKPHCGLGSVKSNIGHLEGAAGAAGLIKILLSMQHGQIPRTLNFGRLNPEIDLGGGPFYIVDRNQDWTPFRDEKGRELPRRASVSSFGFGGANAHAVLEEYRSPGAQAATTVEDGSRLIPLSARSQDQLIERARQLLDFVERLGRPAGASPDRVLNEIAGLLRARFDLGEEPAPDLEWEDLGWGPVETRLFLAALEETHGIRLHSRSLIEHPSLRSLAERIHREMRPGQEVETAGGASLADVAYTLQVGREPMEERAAFVAASPEELASALRRFVAGERGVPNCYCGYSRPLEGGERQAVETGLARRDLPALASLWVRGVEIDWQRLYPSARPRRAHLPTYPFARERFWISRARSPRRVPPPSGKLRLEEYRFSSVLTGDEFYVADHVIQGRRLLPAVAYLEMAREAVESLFDGEDGGRGRICLKSFAWVRPLSVDRKPARVSLRLTPDGDGLGLEIYGGPDDGSGSAVLHGQGRAETGSAAVAPVLDVEAWRARCTKAHYAAEDCYRAFAALGYEYGPAQQGITALHVGADEILARLTLPAFLLETRDKFVLHPTMADAAVQATIGFSLAARRDPSEAAQPALPFEVQSTEIFSACTPSMWAAVRRHDASRNGHGGGTFDIDLCDETGRLCARFQGLTLRAAGPGAASEAAVAGETGIGEMILTPLWEPMEAGSEEAPRPSGRMAIVGGSDHQRAALREQEPEARPLELEPEDSIETMREKIAAWGQVGHLVWIVPDHRPGSLGDEALLTAQRQGVYFGFRLIKALLGEGYGDRPLTWSVITTGTQAVQGDEIASPTHAGVHGLIGSMAKEYADWNVRLMDLPSAGDWPWSDLLTIAGDPHGNASAWRDHRWYRQQLVPYRPAAETAAAYRPGGVYVVIGGAGGIGEVWSEALLRRMPVQLVWIGRRPKDAAIQATLDRLAGLGPAPLYISADATDREQLEGARDTVKREFGRIDGVIHAAIVLQDRSLASLTEDELRTGLAPKIDVCVRMAQVFGGEALDFVLFFSSMLSFLKWPGQSNYVAGCTFKDAFAHRLAAEWPCRVRVINWGYWGSVGAAASERHRSLMARKGFGSIELPEAMAILDRLLAGQVRQLVYMKTTDPAAFDGVGTRLDQWAAHAEETLPSCIDGLRRARLVRAADEWRPSLAWSRTHQEIEEALYELLWAQLQSTPPGVLDRYARWLERSRAELEARGFLGKTADVEAVWQSWEARKGAWLRDADWQAQVQLSEVALRALPDVLTGRALATDVLLGDLFSDVSLVSEVYRSGAVTRFCNQTLAGAVARYVEERRRQDPGCRIRILEIGAGTGGTSVSVFEALRAHEASIEEYTFTDLSRAFLAVAKKALAVQPAYLKYETFDVEMPPAGQAIETGGYDLVIATNVLHATRDIRKTLRNAKAVLKANGLVLLNEISINSFFHHLTFGLLEGWWLFADPELRAPGGPALRPETWKTVLEQEGLRSVFFPAEATHGWGQQVLVAESDGFLRQSVGRPALPPQPGLEDVAGAEEPGSGPDPFGPFAPFARNFDTSPAGIAEIMGQPREIAAGHLLAYLGLRVAETLSVDPATLDSRSRPFANALLGEFGMDSLSSNSLRNALRREIGVDIPVQRIIAEKVHHIIDELYEQLLLQHVSHDPHTESGEETETFVF